MTNVRGQGSRPGDRLSGTRWAHGEGRGSGTGAEGEKSRGAEARRENSFPGVLAPPSQTVSLRPPLTWASSAPETTPQQPLSPVPHLSSHLLT